MRSVPAAMQAQLDAGATTFCQCWRIDRAFGAPLGFTDHDEDVAFEGVTHEAAAGFAASAVERSLGLAIDNAAATGVLRSDRITEADIQAGVYDGAEIRQWIVDWREPENRLLNFRGEIGEIKRGELAFEVELRGLSERLNRPTGRNFLHICDAALGDAACKADISGAAFRGVGTVLSVEDARTVVAGGLGAYGEGWFDDGALTWIDGPLTGRPGAVRAHWTAGGEVRLLLGADLIVAPETGDGFEVIAGCDKRLETCREKFSNALNFQGFPYIPGDGWTVAYPAEGGVHDGGSRE